MDRLQDRVEQAMQRFEMVRDGADQLISAAERFFGSARTGSARTGSARTEPAPAEPAPAEPAPAEPASTQPAPPEPEATDQA